MIAISISSYSRTCATSSAADVSQSPQCQRQSVPIVQCFSPTFPFSLHTCVLGVPGATSHGLFSGHPIRIVKTLNISAPIQLEADRSHLDGEAVGVVVGDDAEADELGASGDSLDVGEGGAPGAAVGAQRLAADEDGRAPVGLVVAGLEGGLDLHPAAALLHLQGDAHRGESGGVEGAAHRVEDGRRLDIGLGGPDGGRAVVGGRVVAAHVLISAQPSYPKHRIIHLLHNKLCIFFCICQEF